jgi:hypothetical protein
LPDDPRNRDGGGPTQPPGASKDGGSSAGTSSSGAGGGSVSTSQLIKDQDVRIATLERQIGIMETEFRRELEKLSANESETATFWQAKHSALNQQFLRTDTELRLLRDEMDTRDPDPDSELETEREMLRTGLEVAMRDMKSRDDEIRDLKNQVRGLKEWVSTSTRSDGEAQTSDEVFGEGMARLGNGLQNWIIVNFRRAKIGKFPRSQSRAAPCTCTYRL